MVDFTGSYHITFFLDHITTGDHSAKLVGGGVVTYSISGSTHCTGFSFNDPVNEYELEDCVTLTGYVSHYESLGYLSMADVLVFIMETQQNVRQITSGKILGIRVKNPNLKDFKTSIIIIVIKINANIIETKKVSTT